ncbi:hypothetical protein NM688_g6300 [Phlebia brevispora]|uniref:Uncharacterized protein n=1 Tax=Phlebia brevispora TaxID=194682 RepID=A0ACC1SHK9_9APHY|nr:hypothetical protein NM688_g6300 [Phlebia brevispora]
MMPAAVEQAAPKERTAPPGGCTTLGSTQKVHRQEGSLYGPKSRKVDNFFALATFNDSYETTSKINMDKTASVVAALDAGKLPSQQQISAFIDWFLNSPLAQVEPSVEGGELSEQGRILINDIQELLISYKNLGEKKNGDNLIQQALWHLSQADYSSTTTQITDDASKDQARKDASALAHAIRTVFNIIWSNLSQESSHVFHDFASFMRLALADAADYVSRTAGSTAEKLRDANEEIERGERNELGVKNVPEDQKFKNKDPKEQWERAAVTVKVVGSKTIGAGQIAVQTSEDLANKSSERLQDAFYQVGNFHHIQADFQRD